MKTKIICLAVLLFGAAELKAQSWRDLLKSDAVDEVVSSVTGGNKLTSRNVVGLWKYAKPTVVLESNDPLKDAAASIATDPLEQKLSAMAVKSGITPEIFNFDIKSDGTFTTTIKSKKIKGTYTIDADNGKMTFNFGIFEKINIGKLTARVKLTNKSLSLLFDASKLLSIAKQFSEIAVSDVLPLIETLIGEYDSMLLGAQLSGDGSIEIFEDDKKSESTEALTNVFKSFF